MLESQLPAPRSPKRRQLLAHALTGLASLALPWPLKILTDYQKREKISYIATLARLPSIDSPLYTLREFRSDEDMEIKQQIFYDIQADRNLIGQLQDRFGRGCKLNLTIEALDIRLLYVPEMREKYRLAYEHYCHSVIDYLFQKTQTDNLYQQIVSPCHPLPAVKPDGISALLVHQLAKEYRAVCCFRSDQGVTARYRFEGTCYSKRLGAVAVLIESPEPGQYRVQREKVTIWQNRCRHIYPLMQLPVEETLHYMMGPYTDARIIAVLSAKDHPNLATVQKIANQWIAIEEALVGGLSHLVLRGYALKNGIHFSSEDLRYLRQRQGKLPRYRYRHQGFKLVKHLGFSRSISLYREDPDAFYRRLIDLPVAAESSSLGL